MKRGDLPTPLAQFEIRIDNEPVAPYTPLRVENRKISC